MRPRPLPRHRRLHGGLGARVRPTGESGFELARQLSAPDKGAAALILISTHAQADFADLIAESPAAGFLPKQELSADAVRRIVDGRGPAGPAAAPAH